MATVFSKVGLSSSTNGQLISIAATTSPGTSVHTAQSSTSTFDEVWIYATNINTASVNLFLEWGTTGSTNEIRLSIPAQSGLTLVIPGLILQNAKTVKAYASTANVVLLCGYVNRIS